ncbi:hypothetical protein B0H65DRAFT_422233, partial [Neurospora tetraspora]
HRKIKPKIFKKIDDTSKLNTIQTRKIITIVRKDFPKSVYTKTNIYNICIYIRRRNFDSYTPTNTLFKLFNNNNIKYIKK